MKILILILCFYSLTGLAATAKKFQSGSKFTFNKSIGQCGQSTYVVDGKVQCSLPVMRKYCLITGSVSRGQNCHLSSTRINSGLKSRDMTFSPTVTCPLITCENNALNAILPNMLMEDALTVETMKATLGDVVSISEEDADDLSDLPSINSTGRNIRRTDLDGGGMILPRRLQRGRND